MGMKSAGLVATVATLFATALSAQILRPTVPVVMPRPVVKVPGVPTPTPTPTPTPAPASASGPTHSTIPAHFTTHTLEFIGTAAGTEPSKSPDVYANGTENLATDFTISVPVVIKNVPPMYTGARAYCQVMLAGDPANPDPYSLGHTASDNWGTRVPLVGGGFAGNAVVKFNVSPGYDPAAARLYLCKLVFEGVDRETSFISTPSWTTYRGPISYTPPISSAEAPQTITSGVVP